ncbi:hypothetical protein CfE428DRAFT_6189 [Chthoniobacter flavus Ellin428]|uniref:Uncharacterized protein n=1 Tax=Chthoniobacter flavus Ellin428 TaxID=497964 RepID=B4DB98_9BACT|nr:hypothetical protein CfE428DRAFT_6189 [Chthoniobacter flavus Ellin428]TCO84718.1 hypothetical protein EV701_13423 [Chthoniobacter flavus]
MTGNHHAFRQRVKFFYRTIRMGDYVRFAKRPISWEKMRIMTPEK